MNPTIEELKNKCKIQEIIDLLISQYVDPNLHINIDLSNFSNAIQEHEYFNDGKYHFQYALQAMYNKPFHEALQEFINGLKFELSQGDITEECLDKFLLRLYDWYIDNNAKKLIKNLLSFNFDDIYIKSEESVFSLLTYIYKSPALSDTYSFNKKDIRRQLFHRLETIAISVFNRFRNFDKQFKDNFLYMIKLNYRIDEIIEQMVRIEEVNIRRNFITEIYYNIEHFFSVLVNEFNITITNERKKQSLLLNILDYFQIDHKIELGTKLTEIFERLNEDNDNFKMLFDGMKNTKTTYLEINNRLINRRNSLHSNGFIGGKGETHLSIGKVKYPKIEKFESFDSMGAIDLSVLIFFIIECCERIIDKTVLEHPELIIDRHMQEMEQYTK